MLELHIVYLMFENTHIHLALACMKYIKERKVFFRIRTNAFPRKFFFSLEVFDDKQLIDNMEATQWRILNLRK